MKYRIIRYMASWAIQRREWFFVWRYVRHGDYWPEFDQSLFGKVLEFETRKEAEEYLSIYLWVRKEDIA